MISPMNLTQVILRAINGYASGEPKTEVVQTVTQFIDNNYIETMSLVDIGKMPAIKANELNLKSGFEVCIKDGEFHGFKISQFKRTNQVRSDAS